jgi:thymidylate synthase
MEIFRSASADDLWRQAFGHLSSDRPRHAVPQKSRAGQTSEILHVIFELSNPRQRWVVSRHPAINPAFAIAEVIWILAGSNDAAILNYWNRQLPKFAGATSIYPGAYGHRLRSHFGFDQIRRAVDALKADPDTRQVALQLWDPTTDLPFEDGRPQTCDVPCNVTSLLKVREGRLHWTQVMRSNDIVRGFPYNVIQFTTIQEIVAGWLGVEVGSYHHWSDSLHIYESDLPEFSIGSGIEPASNGESLMTTVHEGELLIAEMYQQLQRLTDNTLNRSELERLGEQRVFPAGYRSLLAILAAEAARKHSWFDLMDQLEEGCANAQLLQVWKLWKQSRAVPSSAWEASASEAL